MMKYLIVLHVLGACVWTGGHLVLALSVLPKALKRKNHQIIADFESHFKKIGIPALFVQVITGIIMAAHYLPLSEWFTFNGPVQMHIGLKLILLVLTFALAIHARLFIIPKLSTGNLKQLGWHIAAVTVIAVLMVFIGLNFRLRIV